MRTLLLDSTYFPIKVISWQKAIILIVTGRAEVVDEYNDITIRSVSLSIQLPKVLRLFGRHQNIQTVKFSRENVFFRDKYQCQYCLARPHPTDLTFDHVVPLSRNGTTCWENIVTCCKSCNSKKGARTPSEANMKLNKIPRRPNWTPELCLRLKEDDPEEWWEFIPRSKLAS